MPLATVSDLDRYLFDVNGYVVVPGVLDAATLRSLNDVLEADCAVQEARTPGQKEYRFSIQSQAVTALRALIDHEPVLPYLSAWLGADCRLDHAYAMVMRPQSGTVGAFHIHGGGVPFHASRHYHCHGGHIHSSETAISYALTDVLPGEGGMGVIPGSHKANFALPFAHEPGSYDPQIVRQVPVAAGSAVIFTESLTHCTLPWRGLGTRRALFYKYTPRNIQVTRPHFDTAVMPGLTERQRRLLEPAHT